MRLSRTVLLLALLSLVATPASGASEAPPPDQSAIAQYIEQVPAAEGGRSIIHARGLGAQRRLTPRIEAKIAAAGPDAPLLKEVASSNEFGAPTATHAAGTRVAASGATQAAGGTAARASHTGFNDALVGVAVLALGTLAAGALTRRRRRADP